MTHPNETLLRSLYDACSRRDLDTARSLFADGIVFHPAGPQPDSGDYRGVDGVLGLLRTLASAPVGPSGRRSMTCWPPTSTPWRCCG